MKRYIVLFFLLTLPITAWGQNISLPGASINAITCDVTNHGKNITITDPDSHEDCTTGGGTDFPPHICECYWNGASGIWRLHSHSVIDNDLKLNGSLHVEGSGTKIILETPNNGLTALSRTMVGLEFINAGMNTSLKYTHAVKFMSDDSAFTTETPKFLAAIIGRATQAYSADNHGGMALDFAATPISPGATSLPLVRLTIDGDGFVGIGTTSPEEQLHIVNASGPTNLKIEGTGAGILMEATAAPADERIAQLFASTSGQFRIRGLTDAELQGVVGITLDLDTGNVGIGTASPATNFHISESSTDTVPTVEIEQLSTGDAALQFSITGDSYAMGIDNSDGDRFKISYSSGAGTAVLGTTDRFLMTPTVTTIMSTNGGQLVLHRDDATVVDGTDLGFIKFTSDDPTPDVEGAKILVESTVNWSTNNHPSRFRFQTDEAGTLTDRVVIDGTRALRITDVMNLAPRVTAPTSPSIGDVYVDSTGSDALCVYLNGVWVVAAGGGSCV